MSSGYEDERGYWEERIRSQDSQDRYAGVGIQSLQRNVNRYRKEALFEVIGHVLEEQGQDLRGCRVLDAACGTGIYADYYGSAGADVVGVDLSLGALGIAMTHGTCESLAVANLSALPFPDAAFDLTHAFSVLYHVTDDGKWRRSLAELGRVTRTGGLLVMRIDWVDRTEQRAPHVKHRARDEYLRALTEEQSFILAGVHSFQDLIRYRNVFVFLNRFLPAPVSEAAGTLVNQLHLMQEHPREKVVVFRKQ